MRTVLGFTAFIEGGHHLAEDGFDITLRNLAADTVYLACGAALLVGFLTPAFSLLFGLGVILSLCIAPATPLGGHLWCNSSAGIYIVVISVALAMFGPGTFSLDARLFGRHEIIIPDD